MATSPAPEPGLPAFERVAVHRRPLAAGMAQEARWLAEGAAQRRSGAHLWTAAPGIVVPWRCTAAAGWPAAA
ncbi:MAG: hypothetical protein KGL18_03560, partial [Burkholderiales bacterium]|nr:hypothetical protein [Burkholderiales bacterium]